MRDDPSRLERFDAGIALHSPSVQVDGHIHLTGFQGNRNIEAMRGEQLEAADEGNCILQPSLRSVKQPVPRIGAAEGMQCRHGNEQVAKLQRPQHQHNGAAVFSGHRALPPPPDRRDTHLLIEECTPRFRARGGSCL